jgi:hypothetical protein
MKKTVFILVCTLSLAAFQGCKSKVRTAGEMARVQHEKLMNQDYRGYVDAIYMDEFLIPTEVAAIPEQKEVHLQQHARVLQQKVEPIHQAKGGLKTVAVKQETVARAVKRPT